MKFWNLKLQKTQLLREGNVLLPQPDKRDENFCGITQMPPHLKFLRASSFLSFLFLSLASCQISSNIFLSWRSLCCWARRARVWNIFFKGGMASIKWGGTCTVNRYLVIVNHRGKKGKLFPVSLKRSFNCVKKNFYSQCWNTSAI